MNIVKNNTPPNPRGAISLRPTHPERKINDIKNRRIFMFI